MNRESEPVQANLVDMVFPVRGESLARDHRSLLAGELVRRLPWLGRTVGCGMQRVNVVAGLDDRALLSARSRLTLRVPRERADEVVADLSGASIQIQGERLQIGAPTLRELLPHRTLYAHFVAAASDDELAFLADVDAELKVLGVVGKTICGRQQTVAIADGCLTGFSLMLDGLGPAAALCILENGLGPQRALGCGLFVPHKSAAAVGA